MRRRSRFREMAYKLKCLYSKGESVDVGDWALSPGAEKGGRRDQ